MNLRRIRESNKLKNIEELLIEKFNKTVIFSQILKQVFLLILWLSSPQALSAANHRIVVRRTQHMSCEQMLQAPNLSPTPLILEDLVSETYFTVTIPRDFLLMPKLADILANNSSLPKTIYSNEPISIIVKQTVNPKKAKPEWQSELVSQKGPLFQEIMARVDIALDDMEAAEVLKPAEVANEKAFERNIDLTRSTYFSFWDPENPTRPAMTISLYDGSQAISADPTFEDMLFLNHRLLPEESKYRIEIPERKTIGVERIFSLRRLGAERGILDGVYPLLDKVAEYLIFRHGYSAHSKNRWLGGALYLTAGRSGRTNYVNRYKFQTVLGPQNLHLEKDSTPLWIQRMGVNDFLLRYLYPEDFPGSPKYQ